MTRTLGLLRAVETVLLFCACADALRPQGYALVEYETRSEADAAIAGASGTELLGQTIHCDYAVVKGPSASSKASAPDARQRGRSRSPTREQPLKSRID